MSMSTLRERQNKEEGDWLFDKADTFLGWVGLITLKGLRHAISSNFSTDQMVIEFTKI